MVNTHIQGGQNRGIGWFCGVLRIRVRGVPATEEIVFQNDTLDGLHNGQFVGIVDLHRSTGEAVIVNPLGIDGGKTHTAGGSGGI